MLNWTLRYLPVVALLDELEARDVLDVGSGWHGLSWYRRGSVVQTDLAFPSRRPDGQPIGRAMHVCASAERLPFRAAAFDYVVSLDLIEHLPASLRVPAVRELTRVARRGVLVGFPAGPVAATTDRRLHRALNFARQPIPAWLEEHLAQSDYPDADTVIGALPAGWTIVRNTALGNANLMFAVVLGEHLPVVHRLSALADRWYRRRRPSNFVNRGRSYRRLWLLAPASPEAPADTILS
jgi:SAM-dependent methyltransferase